MFEILNWYGLLTLNHLFAQATRLKKKFHDNPCLIIHEFSEDKGKRHTQKYECDFFGDSVDEIVTIDSDTILAPNSTAHLVLLFADPTVGVVTGDVKATPLFATVVR